MRQLDWNQIIEYLNSAEFYTLSQNIGIHVSALVFTAFAIIMVAMLSKADPPRPKVHFLWTWIIISLAYFLVRALFVRYLGDDGRIFLFALAWWNLTISGIVALIVYVVEATDRFRSRD